MRVAGNDSDESFDLNDGAEGLKPSFIRETEKESSFYLDRANLSDVSGTRRPTNKSFFSKVRSAWTYVT